MRILVLSLFGTLIVGLSVMAQTPPAGSPPPVVRQPVPGSLSPVQPLPEGQPSTTQQVPGSGDIYNGTVLSFVDVARPKPGSLEEAIAAALKQHPDVKVAEAKRMVAEAELDQAKMLVTQKVTMLHAKVQLAKLKVEVATKDFERIKARVGAGIVTEEGNTAEVAMRTAKADLDAATAEFEAAKGSAAKGASGVLYYGSYDVTTTAPPLAVVRNVLRTVPQTGSAAEKLRALNEKKFTLDLKPVSLSEAIDVFVGAGSGLTIRLPDSAKKEYVKNPPLVGPLKGEQTFAAWMQLMLDDFSDASKQQDRMLPGTEGRYDAYVRDYGLLITQSKNAPQGALTLAEFVRQSQATKSSANPFSREPMPGTDPKK